VTLQKLRKILDAGVAVSWSDDGKTFLVADVAV
jgi:hypothetical protein